jgi:oxygen-independent coproporphyrinogen-3 oxidase
MSTPAAQLATSSATEAAGLRRRLEAAPYQAYCYSYPHKTAYRRLAEPRELGRLWSGEDRRSLFLYFHIPFCESRCGYCNLFSTCRHMEEIYMDALERQTGDVAAAIGEASFARVAFGGGTPTHLAPALLERLFDLAEKRLGASLAELPCSLETSPVTALPERLDLAEARGIDRISIGLQSMVPAELAALGRAQQTNRAIAALDQIRARRFPILNIDLIYGIPGQTVDSWLHTLRAVLRWQPEELYLYPLYIRPMTGMARHFLSGSDLRLACYRAARDLLLGEAGYRQLSMRLFRRREVEVTGPVYSCQEHGMVGLGCGARSYTRALHYSDEWAVSRPGIHRILERWISRERHDLAWYGCPLDSDEQRRRYLIKSLLRCEGLDLDAYRRALGGPVEDHFSEIGLLVEAGLCRYVEARFLCLTAAGLELSDAIGPLLFSKSVRAACTEYRVR